MFVLLFSVGFRSFLACIILVIGFGALSVIVCDGDYNFLLVDIWGFAFGGLEDFSPNVGIRWYFFMELFTSFSSLYEKVWLICLIFPLLPLCYALRKDLYTSFFAISIINITLAPRPSLCEWSIVYALIPYVNVSYLSVPLAFLSVPLMFAFQRQWLHLASENANFFFGANLLACGAHLFLFMDAVSKSLVDQYKLKLKKKE